MVKVRQDLTGMMFGNLLVIEQAEDHVKPNGKHLAKWRCQCTCGNITEVRDADLKTGNTKSCGCQNPGKAKVNEYQLNLVDEHGSYGIGYTSNTNEPFYFDMEDYDTIKEQCWCSNKRDNTFVLMANIKGAKCHSSFARFIMPETNTIHMDKNPFNNRRYNLVECNTNEARRNGNIRQNNSSGVSGVSFNERRQKGLLR